MARIPLIEDLTLEPVPPGSNLLVEYDAASQWYNASLTMAAGWLKSGGVVDYNATTQSVSSVRSKLERLGLDVRGLESEGRLELWDWYTATLGRRSDEKLAMNSLKVADLSIGISKTEFSDKVKHAWLGVKDSVSTLSRFNDEKAWVEFELTRSIPVAQTQRSIMIRGVVKAVHSEWVYKRLEDAYDAVIDFRLDESCDPSRNMMRIRSMRDVGFDGKWHSIRADKNSEITLAD